MKLAYRGSIRRLQGAGMAYASFDNAIELNESVIGVKSTTAVPDTYLRIDGYYGDEIDFTVFFFDGEEHYHIQGEQHIHYKKEGNAHGFEFNFYIQY